MDDIALHKQNIDKKIVDKALTEFGNGNITEDDLKEIADFTVEGLKSINNKADLKNFLDSLSDRWTIFKIIATIEEMSNKDKLENEVYSGVLELAKNGQTEEAIRLAKSVTG